MLHRRPNYANSLAKRGSVPIRDETGRFIGVRPKTAAERLQRQPLGSGGIFKSAAVEVLRLERRLMSTGQQALACPLLNPPHPPHGPLQRNLSMPRPPAGLNNGLPSAHDTSCS